MEFKFASINEALQHLSDITGKRIKIATESSIDFYVEKIGYNRSDNSVRYRIDMTISIPSDRTSLIFQSDFDDAENNLVPIAKQKLEDIQKVLAKIDESNIQHIDDIKVGDSDISVFSDGSGYQMKNDQYLIGDGISLNGYALDITSSMTIGFWLHPISMGVAINPDNGGPTSITMPLLDFIEGGSSESSIFRITEQTSESGNNFLRITITQ